MFKQGDRVRYKIGGRDAMLDHVGAEGTLKQFGGVICEVLWDRRGPPSYPNTYNLELIEMTKTIDTTKPLTAVNSTGPLDVTFITETSEGHILVDLSGPNSFVSGWYMFDKQGKFVRSHQPDPRHGSGIVLSNKVVETKLHLRVPASNVGFGHPSYHKGPTGGTAIADIELTYRDGIIVDAKLVRSNTDKARVVKLGVSNCEGEAIVS
jgi:hypothetical protein